MGRLSPRRVRGRVVEALARVLAVGVEMLEATRGVAAPAAALGDAVYAREAAAPPPLALDLPGARAAAGDELDDLFTGADG